MSFGDLFYPGNPKRRLEVISKVQRMYVLMDQNFKATDDLTTFINAHVSPSPNISEIQLDQNATFAVNAQNLIDKMREVQIQVDKIDEKLSKELDPAVYQKLTSNSTNFQQKLDFFKQLKTGLIATELLITSIAGYLLITEVVAAAQFVAVIAGLSEILVASVAGLVVGLFVAGAAIAVDAIVGAIVGAVERSKLEHMIHELNGVLNSFEGPSEEYTKKIFEVLGSLKYILGQPL